MNDRVCFESPLFNNQGNPYVQTFKLEHLEHSNFILKIHIKQTCSSAQEDPQILPQGDSSRTTRVPGDLRFERKIIQHLFIHT